MPKQPSFAPGPNGVSREGDLLRSRFYKENCGMSTMPFGFDGHRRISVSVLIVSDEVPDMDLEVLILLPRRYKPDANCSRDISLFIIVESCFKFA